jgi:SHS2 domain-containing protein
MEKFELLEHKADLKIRAFGKDKEELFENAMIGMFKGARYEEEVKIQKSKFKIKISSLDFPSLLVDFLSEVLYLCETKKLVFEKVEFQKLTEKEMEGTLIGKPLKRMGVHIKGVTYHDLEIHQENGKWQATILFDI